MRVLVVVLTVVLAACSAIPGLSPDDSEPTPEPGPGPEEESTPEPDPLPGGESTPEPDPLPEEQSTPEPEAAPTERPTEEPPLEEAPATPIPDDGDGASRGSPSTVTQAPTADVHGEPHGEPTV